MFNLQVTFPIIVSGVGKYFFGFLPTFECSRALFASYASASIPGPSPHSWYLIVIIYPWDAVF
ncbi:MAG: hypothetical protein ACTSUE_23520 [Promethearchaeota archaeon]